MIVLDTDTFSLLVSGHPKVVRRASEAIDDIVITVITQIEVLLGRFEFVLKAADGEQLLRAQAWLVQSERDLARLTVIAIDQATTREFDRLRQQKKLRKIGRADLLIATIALARRAKVVTRNQKHFRHVPGLAVENWAD